MNQKIPKKIVLIEIFSDDGVLLKGKLEYWGKDYEVYLKEPSEAKSRGYRLQYAVPVKYVVNEVPQKGVTHIDLLPRAKKILVSLYHKHNTLSTDVLPKIQTSSPKDY